MTNVSTYGGITRGTDAVGTAVKAQYNGTGGVFSLDLMQDMFGLTVLEPETADLIITPQAIWDKLWKRAQPSQRYPTGPGFDDIARVGFRVIDFNGAAVVVDSHCQAGRMYFLNTRYLHLIIHTQRNFIFDGWRVPDKQDARIGYIFWAGELVCSSLRLQGQIRNIT